MSFLRRQETIINMQPLQHQYYVYILTNKKHGTLYIGMTNNLKRRIYEHKNKLVEGFTQKYNLDKVVFMESFLYVQDAILREKRMKKWKRQWKINLIEEDNPEWRIRNDQIILVFNIIQELIQSGMVTKKTVTPW